MAKRKKEEEVESEEEEVEETKTKGKKATKPKAKKVAKKSSKKSKEEVEEKVEEDPGEEDEDEESSEVKKGKKKAAEKKEPAPSQTTDFSLPKKDDSSLKISSWNVAGWKSVVGKGFKDYAKNEDPDILCVQETKVSPSDIKGEFLEGYHSHFNGCTTKKGYSGTAIFSKVKPIAWTDGIGIADHDEEGRVITAEYDKFYLVNTYIPNAGKKLVDLEYRLKWDKDFLEYLKKLDAVKPVIWCGDLNVAHLEIDLKNPKTNKKNAGFSPEEREGFSTLLKSGFVDSFRHFYPDEKDAYTFWSYMKDARGKGIGWRLDYFVVSQRSMDKIKDSFRRPNVMGSE